MVSSLSIGSWEMGRLPSVGPLCKGHNLLALLVVLTGRVVYADQPAMGHWQTSCPLVGSPEVVPPHFHQQTLGNFHHAHRNWMTQNQSALPMVGDVAHDLTGSSPFVQQADSAKRQLVGWRQELLQGSNLVGLRKSW